MITQKQERFVEELIKGKSQREAYKAAYNCSRMKDTTIDVKASELLRNGEVTVRYNELREIADAKTGDDAASIRALIIENEKKIANARVTDFYKCVTDERRGWMTVELKDLSEIDTTAIQEIKFDQYGRPMVKLYDRQKAHDNLARLFGIDKEQVDNTLSIKLEVPDEYTK